MVFSCTGSFHTIKTFLHLILVAMENRTRRLCILKRTPDLRCKINVGRAHAKDLIYISFVELESLVLQTKIQEHITVSSEEEDFKGSISAW